MKHLTLTIRVPEKKAPAVKAALEKSLHDLRRAFKLRRPGHVQVDQGNPTFAAVFVTPDAIREHFEGDEELQKRLESITDQVLYDAAVDFLLKDDGVWEEFHRWCLAIIDAAEEVQEKAGA